MHFDGGDVSLQVLCPGAHRDPKTSTVSDPGGDVSHTVHVATC